LHEFLTLRGGNSLEPIDFIYGFLSIGAITMTSVFCFIRLTPHAGAEISGRAVQARQA
jgi:hypothetical protein